MNFINFWMLTVTWYKFCWWKRNLVFMGNTEPLSLEESQASWSHLLQPALFLNELLDFINCLLIELIFLLNFITAELLIPPDKLLKQSTNILKWHFSMHCDIFHNKGLCAQYNLTETEIKLHCNMRCAMDSQAKWGWGKG